jgi:hypothetical protein
MHRGLITILCLLAGFSGFATRTEAAAFRSTEYYCQVTLPDGSYVEPWFAMVPANESGVLTGARRRDFAAYVYVGIVDKKDQPHFVLDDKSIEQLDKSFFGPGLGFLNKTQKINLRGVDGYRLIGRHHFNGRNYAMVVDLYYEHGLVYEVAGLSALYDDALQDSDVLGFMRSFAILPN